MAMAGERVDLRDLWERALARAGLTPSDPGPQPYEDKHVSEDQPGEREFAGGGMVEFVRGEKTYRVSLADIGARFTVGSLYLVQTFNPQTNPDIRIFGLPEPIIAWILHTAGTRMRPGEYQYFLNVFADVSTLTDYIADSNAPSNLPGWPVPPGFKAGNATLTYQSFIIPCTMYTLITFHVDNETNQSCTAQLYGSYTSNPGTPPTGWNAILSPAVSVSAGTDGVASVDLTKNIYPYICCVVTYTTAPTSGFLRIIPVAKRQ